MDLTIFRKGGLSTLYHDTSVHNTPSTSAASLVKVKSPVVRSNVGRVSIALPPPSTNQWPLVSVSSVPETMEQLEESCYNTGLGQVCTNLPRIYSRKVTQILYLVASAPGNPTPSDWDSLENCVYSSLTATAIVSLTSEESTFFPTFIASVLACAQGIAYFQKFGLSLSVESETQDSAWAPV